MPNAFAIPAVALALVSTTVLARSPADREEIAYALDPVHTRVLVAVEHAGFSQALGTLSGSHGALLFDPDDWQAARLDVRIPLARLDFGDADWNRAVLAGKLLDVGRYPEARFVSETVSPLDAGQARVCGQLQLRGVTRPQCMDVTVNAVQRHPMPPFRRTAGFSATATLSRADFGMDAWTSVIGDTVTLRIEAEAIRDDDAASAFTPRADDVPGVTSPDPATYSDIEAAAEAALQDTPADASDIDPATTPEPTP